MFAGEDHRTWLEINDTEARLEINVADTTAEMPQ